MTILDPHALDSGIVRLDGRYFSDLWAICKSRGLTVVADVHVHPGGSGQSDSDRAHPMICQAGHIALILPRFATGAQPRRGIGIYRYLGRQAVGHSAAVRAPPILSHRFVLEG